MLISDSETVDIKFNKRIDNGAYALSMIRPIFQKRKLPIF